MFKEVVTIKEYHKNGTLFFKEKRAIIEPLFVPVFYNFTNFRALENVCFLILEREKYYDNGQIAWSLEWNDKGESIKNNKLKYRKDGTIIQY